MTTLTTQLDDPVLSEGWRERVRHTFASDPEGAFVAEHDGTIVSSNDSRAIRLYELAGFRRKPTFDADGLRLSANGALYVRGTPGTLRAFLPSGPFA